MCRSFEKFSGTWSVASCHCSQQSFATNPTNLSSIRADRDSVRSKRQPWSLNRRPLVTANFREFLFRNCLEIPDKPHCGFSRVLRTQPGTPFHRLACHQTQRLRTPLAIFQTVSPRTLVNKGEKRGRSTNADLGLHNFNELPRPTIIVTPARPV